VNDFRPFAARSRAYGLFWAFARPFGRAARHWEPFPLQAGHFAV
jgi:hypothetical protein